MNYLDTLRQRGLVADVTSEDLGAFTAQGRRTLYAGFDPTCDSLHIGNLVVLMCLKRAQLLGHRPIAVAGGATGMIGDPSGRSSERTLLDEDTLAKNLAGLRQDLSRLIDFDGGSALLVNNADWFAPISFIDFLRDTGKDFSISAMLAKDSVKKRLESESGLSYTEFSYMLLQSYDFLHLYRTYDCTLQVGGSDQWGNITAGADLIRRKTAGRAFGLVFPLILDSAGNKFGKSTGGAVFMSESRTSHFDFYQYFLRTADADAVRYLRYFTLLDEDSLTQLDKEVAERPEKREAQTVLAREVTRMVRGEAGLQAAERATAVLYGGDVSGFDDATLRSIFRDVSNGSIPRAALEAGYPLIDALALTGLAKSKSEARRLIQGGGVSVNNQKCDGGDAGLERKLRLRDLASPSIAVLKSGKKNYALLLVEG